MDSNDAEYDRIMSLSNAEAICDLEKIFQELQRIKAETGKRREQLAREQLEDKLQQQCELNKIFADMLNTSMKTLAIKSERLTQLENEQKQIEEEEQKRKSLAEKAALAAEPSTAITPDMKFVTPEQSSSSNEQFSSVRSSTVKSPAAKKQPASVRWQGVSASCTTTTTTTTMPESKPSKSKSTTLAKSSGSRQSSKKFTVNEDLAAMGKTFGNQRSELLALCQKIMRPYGIPMYEFSASWADGHAYCALIHHYLPHLVDSRYLLCKDSAVTLLYVSELCKSLGVEFEGNMVKFYKLKKPNFVKTCSFVLKLVIKLESLVNPTAS